MKKSVFYERKISIEEFVNILYKMEKYNIKSGYVGVVKNKLELFLQECSKASAFVTIDEVRQKIANYDKEDK